MTWMSKIIRSAGSAFPVTSMLVQLQSDLDAEKIAERITKLEDPISFLHEDIPDLSKQIYDKTRATDKQNLEFERDFYTKNSKPLAILDAKGFIEGVHALGKGNEYVGGFWLRDPTYVMYMCQLAEDSDQMERLLDRLESAQAGDWLTAAKLQETLKLPTPVINAAFQIYEARGYGICSKEVGSCSYLAKA